MKKAFTVFVSLFATFSLFFNMTPLFVHATPSSLLQQIDEAEKQKQAIEEEKQAVQGEKDEKKNELNQLQYQQGTLKAQLDSFNENLAEENRKYEEICDKISAKKDEIEIKKQELADAKADEEEQYATMKKRLQYIYEQPDDMYLDMILSSKDFATFLNVADYIYMISEYDNNMLEDYKQTTIDVATKEAELEGELANLESLEEQSKEEQSRITELINTTNVFVSQYSAQISDTNNELAEIEKEIAEKEAQIKAQEEDIEALKKQYEEELRLSQLAAQSSRRDISEVSFADNDRYLLANLIYCEAGGEPYEGQLAVGAVVMNRVMSSRYPDTVYEVIYQKSQFSPASSGRLDLALAQNLATASCYQAADEAMSGSTNVGNCVYFRTPVPGLNGTQIGNHIFY
ncbi:MAG: cell wall hydrolase [Lachnospiraceae bacterium]|nr:cell wall hydrolase [Lachnospiraceae bacterium]